MPNSGRGRRAEHLLAGIEHRARAAGRSGSVQFGSIAWISVLARRDGARSRSSTNARTSASASAGRQADVDLGDALVGDEVDLPAALDRADADRRERRARASSAYVSASAAGRSVPPPPRGRRATSARHRRPAGRGTPRRSRDARRPSSSIGVAQRPARTPPRRRRRASRSSTQSMPFSPHSDEVGRGRLGADRRVADEVGALAPARAARRAGGSSSRRRPRRRATRARGTSRAAASARNAYRRASSGRSSCRRRRGRARRPSTTSPRPRRPRPRASSPGG